jgi:FKBP-type peptidyl-prolyl cis-trans isomerase SlyD
MKQVKMVLGAALYSILWIALSTGNIHAADAAKSGAKTVEQGKKISIQYTLTLENKEVADTNVGKEPLSFVEGSHQIIPGLEKALVGMKIGESKKVTVKPEEGYGQVRKEAFVEVDKSKLPPEAQKINAPVQASSQNGQVLRGKVIKINDKKATVDFNHPLAGKTLFFDVKILDIQ